MSALVKTIQLHRKQQEFRRSLATYRGFVGGRGSGKSWVGAYDLIRRAKPGCLYMVSAPTFRVLDDATWRMLVGQARNMSYLRALNKVDYRITLGNGAEIIGRSAEDPERFRGPNLSGIWLDEAGEMKADAFDISIACLREHGEQGWLSATFTPRGRSHWTYKVFGSGDFPGAVLFRAQTKENPFLPCGFVDAIRHRYGATRAAQELEGQFVDIEGAEFDASWFGDSIWFDEWPADSDVRMRVAALDPSKGRDAKSGDYAAFTVIQQTHDGTLWVEADLRRLTVPVIAETALELNRLFKPDGFAIETNQFQELLATEIMRLGNERGVMPPIYSIDNRVNKEVRIRRLTPWLSRGLIRFRDTPGSRLLVDQLQAFPGGDHDDGPDSLEMALRLLIELQGGEVVDDGLGGNLLEAMR